MTPSTSGFRHVATFGLLLFALVGCGADFLPETYVNGLRVLSVRAEPAELRPGESTRVSALVVDPSRPGRPGTLLWVACDPDPLDKNRTACANTDVLADPGARVFPEAGSAPELPSGLHVLGLGPVVTYTAPDSVFAELAADAPVRRSGTVAQLLLIAIAEEIPLDASQEELQAAFERVKSRQTPSVLALFRIRVSDETQVNRNPHLSALEVNGFRLPEGATVRVPERGELTLLPQAEEETFEHYTQHPAEGTPQEKDEKLLTAWYSTLGRFKEPRLTLPTEVEQRFRAPAETPSDPLPRGRQGTLWVVVRDTRGGQGWHEYPVFVCDPTSPKPTDVHLRTLEGLSGGSHLLELEGEGLAGIFEVELGGTVLRDGLLFAEGVYSGRLPPLEPGEYTVWLRTRDCQDVALPERFRVLP